MKTTQQLIIACISILSFINAHAQLQDAIRFRIHDLNGSGKTDECVIRFLPSATDGYDGSYDAVEMFSINPNVPITYTKTSDSTQKPLAINSLPTLTQTRNVDLYTYTPVSGNYKIESINLGPFAPNVKITLKDNVTKQTLSLDTDTAMQFTVTQNDTVNARFSIEFNYGQVVGVASNASSNALSAGFWNGQLHIKGAKSVQHTAVEVYSTSGQLVYRKDRGELTQSSISVPNLTNGIYVVMLREDENLWSDRIFVQ